VIYQLIINGLFHVLMIKHLNYGLMNNIINKKKTITQHKTLSIFVYNYYIMIKIRILFLEIFLFIVNTHNPLSKYLK